MSGVGQGSSASSCTKAQQVRWHRQKKEITKADFCAVQTFPPVLAKALTVQRFQLGSEEGHRGHAAPRRSTHTLLLLALMVLVCMA